MKSAKNNRKPSIKSKGFQASPNQQRITKFFQKPSSQNVQPEPPKLDASSQVPGVLEINKKLHFNPKLDAKKSKIAQCPPKLPSMGEDEVILISDSESDHELDIPAAAKKRSSDPHTRMTSLTGNGENNSLDNQSSKYFEASIAVATEDTKQYDDSMGSDSGDEILSQLDIDEIISSQEMLSPDRLSNTSRNSNENITPKVINTSPSKSPKAKVNYYSPLRRLNSPSKAKISRNSGIKSSSPGTSSSQSFKSPNSSRKQSVVREHENSPKVKKLRFPDDASDSSPQFVPYFLKNFTSVIDSVSNDPHSTHLFNEEEKFIIYKFRSLSMQAKLLYVRLFLRKWKWKIASSIKYPEIKDDLTSVFDELHSAALIVEIKDVQDELELKSLLEILSAEQITALAKQMNVTSKKKTKDGLEVALLALTKTKPVFATACSVETIMRRKTLELLGVTYQLEGTCRALFSRMFVMHSPPQYWEDEQDQSSNQLLKMLMSDNGRMLYPQYNINKTTIIYTNRDDLLRFHDAWTIHCSITAYTESKEWEEVVKLGETAFTLLEQNLQDSDIKNKDKDLPSFLRVYKAGSVLTRIVWLAVEGYQKLKNYKVATSYIHFLLKQNIYLSQYRGRWHERLVINQKQYLKTPLEERKLTLVSALKDEFLQESHKLCISERFDKLMEEIQKPPKKKAKTLASNEATSRTNHDTLLETSNDLFRLREELPVRTIAGEKLLNPNSGKSVFISQQDDDGSSEASSVEFFAISYYQKHEGYMNGIHAEGAVVCSLFGLLFWDEIYSGEISDAFHSQYQIAPLDLNFQEFFTRRQGIILDKLQGMRSSWSIQDAIDVLEKNWNQHCNVLSIVNWSVFSDVELAKSLLSRMGLRVMSDICERLARNFRHWRSGFPDLVLWNHKDVIFVEVKGPGDSLSFKQKVWLDFLLSIGAKAEVCHVQAVSNKKIRT